jgi:hypothetical protein
MQHLSLPWTESWTIQPQQHYAVSCRNRIRRCEDELPRHQDRNKWWGLRNTVMTFLVPQNTVNFLISPGLFKFQGRLCSMEWAGHYQTYIILPLHYCGTMAKLQTECHSIMGLFPEIYLIPKMPNQECGPPSLLVNGHCMTCQLVPSSHEAHRSPLPGVQAKKSQKIPPLPNKPLWHAHNPLYPFTFNIQDVKLHSENYMDIFNKIFSVWQMCKVIQMDNFTD